MVRLRDVIFETQYYPTYSRGASISPSLITPRKDRSSHQKFPWFHSAILLLVCRVSHLPLSPVCCSCYAVLCTSSMRSLCVSPLAVFVHVVPPCTCFSLLPCLSLPILYMSTHILPLAPKPTCMYIQNVTCRVHYPFPVHPADA